MGHSWVFLLPAEKVGDMLHRALEAFLQRYADLAHAIPAEDDEIDALFIDGPTQQPQSLTKL